MYIASEDRNALDDVSAAAASAIVASDKPDPDLLLQALLAKSYRASCDPLTVQRICERYVAGVLDVMFENLDVVANTVSADQSGSALLIEELIRRGLVVRNLPAADPPWPWPLTQAPAGNAPSSPLGFIENQWSALKLCGYRVGKTQGMGDPERQRFLRHFFTHKLPPVVQAHFDDAYGAPGSEQRLQKMANVIAANCRNFKRNDARRYKTAIGHWESDLNYLRTNYYKIGSFPWPATDY
jgi:hypothetical protein